MVFYVQVSVGNKSVWNCQASLLPHKPNPFLHRFQAEQPGRGVVQPQIYASAALRWVFSTIFSIQAEQFILRIVNYFHLKE